MGAAPKIIDKKALQILVPFNALSPVHFNEVAQKTVVEEVRSGRLIFKEGDSDNQSVYLLEGEINLLAGNEVVGVITAGSDASRHPIAQLQPRQVSARAKSNAVVARVDSSLLDIMLTWDQSSGYEVSEISDDDDDDWMTRILQSQAFLKLPPSNIQRLLMRVESVPVSAGDVIIRQGGDGDYFYIIKNGRCMVTRKPSANAKEVKLAELADGDAFGEDALVSDAKRNATITMLTDGVLMRLAKKDFVELLKEPLLSRLDYPDAAAKVARGAVWLDVRLPGEFENVHITGSRNLPLSALRLEANGLDPASKYIVCCDTGRRSASAAFVLSQRGFEVYVLSDGFGGVPAEALNGSAATAAAIPQSQETAEVVALKPQLAAVVSVAPVAQPSVDTDELADLQGRINALQREKQQLETAQQQIAGRISDLQDELERVRDDSREQILELEQILAEARKDGAAARAELQAIQDTLKTQHKAATSSREQIEALEEELAERRAREQHFQGELKALQARAAELEAATQADAEQWAEVASERARLQARVDELQPLVEQRDAQRAQIAALEAALETAAQQGDQTQAQQIQQAQRLGELEAALQVASAALERAHQEAVRHSAELQAAHDQALQQAQADATQQLAVAQAQLADATAMHAELETRLLAAEQREQAGTTDQQTLREALAALQAQADAERAQVDAQRSRAEGYAEELAQLRMSQAAALEAARLDNARLSAELTARQNAYSAVQAERDSLSAAVADAQRTQAEILGQLSEARTRIEMLQTDAGSQVQQLQGELETLRAELLRSSTEQTALETARATLTAERDAAQTALGDAQARIDALGAAADEQVRQLQTAAEAARDLARSEAESRAATAAELTTAQTRLADLDAALQIQRAAAEALQDRAQAAEQTLNAVRIEQNAVQQTYATAQAELRELETRLGAALQTADTQAVELATLRADLAAQAEARAASERQRADFEELLLIAQADAAQQAQTQQALLAVVQADLAAAEAARAELAQRQIDAVSSQDEQLQQLALLRDELHTAHARLQEVDAARLEIEGRLAEMSASAAMARAALEQAGQAHAERLAAAEQRVRETLEQQLDELQGELDGARAALAREQSQRSNLEQATRAEFGAAQAEIATRLERAERTLQERQQALTESEMARRAVDTQLSQVRAAAAEQQQTLLAELEQLRAATTADLEVMQHQVQQLQEDLKAARRLGAGGSTNEEIERLRLLLDEAREEANSARNSADQWREQAAEAHATLDAGTEVNDELAILRIQFADVQSRVGEALQARDSAQQEAAQLRQALQIRQQQAAGGAAEAASLSQTTSTGRGGLWLGLAAGLLLGAIGAGYALWSGGAQLPVQLSAAATGAKSDRMDADRHVPAQPVTSAKTRAPGVVKPAATTAEKPAMSKGRSLRDALGDGSLGPRLVEIAAAEFHMGSGANSLEFDERPRHTVKLGSFAIATHEVTFDDYDTFARATGRALPEDNGWGRGLRPVINVSWEDAQAYTRWLSEQTGRRYRLPTEAEWEYAAGGFVASLYWWGNTPGTARANCFNCASEWDAKTTAPSGSFPENPLGVYDTAGNVAEWVQDCYHPSYEGAPADGSAWVSVGCSRRVVRGGGYNSPASTLRTSKRDQQPASVRTDDIGFRVAREL